MEEQWESEEADSAACGHATQSVLRDLPPLPLLEVAPVDAGRLSCLSRGTRHRLAEHLRRGRCCRNTKRNA